jgi:hypothetical protein
MSTVANAPHDPALVEVWVTPPIEADYERRHVFPALRRSNALGERQNAFLALVSQKEASAIALDATEQYDKVATGLRRAYSALAKRIEEECEAAKQRPTDLACLAPFYADRSSDWFWYLSGTKAQLQAAGIGVGVLYPGEPGAACRSIRTTDAYGNQVTLSIESEVWATYKAEVRVSNETRERRTFAKKHARDQQARIERLKSLPQTREQFRRCVADAFWKSICETLQAMRPPEGFRIDDDDCEEFKQLAKEAFWFLKDEATVVGKAPARVVESIAVLEAQRDDALQDLLRAVGASKGISYGQL